MRIRAGDGCAGAALAESAVVSGSGRSDSSACARRPAGIRVPDHGFARDVCRGAGGALALTSANLSGAPAALEAADFQHLWPSCSAVFDGAALEIAQFRESQILGCARCMHALSQLPIKST